ncbi:MAG: undecaprenyl-diphosphate phosphatase [Patescibacteria group bacterium]
MTYLQAIILGLIQGLTEFLPVSSSGHLAISQALFGIGETALSTIFLHFATLLAIVIYFWSSIRQLSLRQWIGIWLASLPVFVVGFLARDWLEVSSQNLSLVGWSLLVTAGLNFLTGWLLKTQSVQASQKIQSPTLLQMMKVGLTQVVALLPGVSRSGTTIATGMKSGLSRQSAFEFSFLLAIPAILVATGYQIYKIIDGGAGNFEAGPLLLASLIAFGGGYLSLRWLAQFLKQAEFKWFGVYAGLMGLMVLMGQWLF